MAKREIVRGRTAIVLFVVLVVGSYVLNGWLASKGMRPFIHGGAPSGWKPYAGECAAFGLNLWVPCWVAAGAPVIVLLAAAGFLRGRD
jgi:hypothetical protein